MDRTDFEALSIAPADECGVCRADSSALIDVHGAAICEDCLRRIDANPREKRQLLMFAASDSLYL